MLPPHHATTYNREVAALKTLTKADALALWDARIAAAAPSRRKLAVYVFSKTHADAKLTPSSTDDGGKTVVVDSMASLRELKRGLPLYSAPRAVVKEESLFLSSAVANGGAAGPAAAAS